MSKKIRLKLYRQIKSRKSTENIHKRILADWNVPYFHSYDSVYFQLKLEVQTEPGRTVMLPL